MPLEFSSASLNGNNLRFQGCSGPLTKRLKDLLWNNDSNLLKAINEEFRLNTRAMLRSTWSSFNRANMKKVTSNTLDSENGYDCVLTPIQTVLYPAISSYADVLLTVENPIVSK